MSSEKNEDIDKSDDVRWYDALKASLEEMEPHKVLYTLLVMRIKKININQVVHGELDQESLLKLFDPTRLTEKQIQIVQHLKEFDVQLPKEFEIPEPKAQKPKGIDKDHHFFAQHYLARRTEPGRSILGGNPACQGLCFEYVIYNKKNNKMGKDDFLDKLLKNIHKHSSNFYERVKYFQSLNLTPDVFFKDNSKLAIDEKGLSSEIEKNLKGVEFVQLILDLKNNSHGVVIRCLGDKYQFFDPNYYDARWLTAQELDELYTKVIEEYTKKWGWGELKCVKFRDIGAMVDSMSILTLDEETRKRPYKNAFQVVKGLNEENLDLLRPYLKKFSFKEEQLLSVKNASISSLFIEFFIKNIKEKEFFIKQIMKEFSKENYQIFLDELKNMKSAITREGRIWEEKRNKLETIINTMEELEAVNKYPNTPLIQ